MAGRNRGMVRRQLSPMLLPLSMLLLPLAMLPSPAAATGGLPPPSPPGTCSGECRRPWFHYTALNMTTSDPNGLQWRRTASGAISYEFFHQDRNSYTQNHPAYCKGNEGSGSAWGHARSPDMLHWESMPVSGICASTGGGVTLPPDFRGPDGERWLAAMIASAPGGSGAAKDPKTGKVPVDPVDTNGVGRGLKLWTSNDSEVQHFAEYLPPNTTVDPKFLVNNACVICPARVREGPSNPPSAGRSSFLGDSFTWSEPPWNVPSTNRTWYVLSGGGTCKAGKPAEFCGWSGSTVGGAQALLFSSKNLVDWRYVSDFYLNSRSDDAQPPDAGQGHAIMTPDTFSFPTGEQAFIYLGKDNTRWITGNTTRKDGELHKFVEQGFNGNSVTDLVDSGGGTHCGQSFWDPKDRRVQFMWLKVELPYATWIGAPTMPREIVLAPAGSATGLWFRPLPEMSLLHVDGSQRNTSLVLSDDSDGWQDVTVVDGLHAHLLLTISLPNAAATVSIEVRAATTPRATGSLMVNVSRGAIQISGGPCTAPVWPPCELKAATRATLRNSSIVELEIFVDGPLTEIFANGGERALTSSANVLYLEGAALRATATGGSGAAASLTATSYAMKRSVHVNRTEMLRTAKTDDNSAMPEWNQDRFVISALNAPPAGLTGRFSGSMDLLLRYRQLRGANFTMVLGQLATEVTAAQPYGNTETILTAAEHAGLKVLLLPLGSIDTNASTEQVASSLSNSSSAALWGWHLADEPPDVAHFKKLASWKRLIDRHRPGKLSYVNLLPPSCVHYSQGPWGYSGYDGSQNGYLNQFISAIQKPQVMSFDLYPYFEASDSGAMPTKDCGGSCDNCATAQGDSTPSCCCCNCTRSGYRRSLESHRLASRRLGGTPSWVYLNILPYNGHRDPTIGQIAWQVFTALTYGAKGILYFVNWPDPDPKLFGYGDALIVRKAAPTAGGVSGASIRVADYIPGHHMEEVTRINSIVLAYGKYLLRATSTAIFHLPATAADGGSHAAALNASRILDDLSGGCDCASSPGGQGCDLLLQGFEHCGHYLVGEFRLEDGRPALMIHNQDPDGAQWPTIALHYGISYGRVLEVDPVHETLAPVLDSSPLLPGLQLRLAPGMARLFVITT